jgi:hypothetical protein
MRLDIDSSAELNTNVVRMIAKDHKSGEIVKCRLSFEFPDVGEIVHPVLFIEYMGNDGHSITLAELPLMKSDLLMALDICKRMEQA